MMMTSSMPLSGEPIGEQYLVDTLIWVEILLPHAGEEGAGSKAFLLVSFVGETMV